MFERTKSKNVGAPFFGDLPYVGWAFKQEQIQDENSELLIFLTPKILKRHAHLLLSRSNGDDATDGGHLSAVPASGISVT